jgi:cytoskeletal protein CcmA (bactofilin family)
LQWSDSSCKGGDHVWIKATKNGIAKGLKIVGSVTAEGLVEVNGQIDGELHCTSLVIARGAQVKGTVAAERVVVDGKVEGPIREERSF